MTFLVEVQEVNDQGLLWLELWVPLLLTGLLPSDLAGSPCRVPPETWRPHLQPLPQPMVHLSMLAPSADDATDRPSPLSMLWPLARAAPGHSIHTLPGVAGPGNRTCSCSIWGQYPAKSLTLP